MLIHCVNENRQFKNQTYYLDYNNSVNWDFSLIFVKFPTPM